MISDLSSDHFQASSFLPLNAPKDIRFNRPGWSPSANDVGKWIIITFNLPVTVFGLDINTTAEKVTYLISDDKENWNTIEVIIAMTFL